MATGPRGDWDVRETEPRSLSKNLWRKLALNDESSLANYPSLCSLWLWIYIVKVLIFHRWRISWSWICLRKLIKLRAFSGMLPCHVLLNVLYGFFCPGCRRRMDTPRRCSARKYCTAATMIIVSPVEPNGSSLLSLFNESKDYQDHI